MFWLFPHAPGLRCGCVTALNGLPDARTRTGLDERRSARSTPCYRLYMRAARSLRTGCAFSLLQDAFPLHALTHMPRLPHMRYPFTRALHIYTPHHYTNTPRCAGCGLPHSLTAFATVPRVTRPVVQLRLPHCNIYGSFGYTHTYPATPHIPYTARRYCHFAFGCPSTLPIVGYRDRTTVTRTCYRLLYAPHPTARFTRSRLPTLFARTAHAHIWLGSITVYTVAWFRHVQFIDARIAHNTILMPHTTRFTRFTVAVALFLLPYLRITFCLVAFGPDTRTHVHVTTTHTHRYPHLLPAAHTTHARTRLLPLRLPVVQDITTFPTVVTHRL